MRPASQKQGELRNPAADIAQISDKPKPRPSGFETPPAAAPRREGLSPSSANSQASS
jgi:hypothetical protein